MRLSKFGWLRGPELISDEGLFSELKRYYGIYFKGWHGRRGDPHERLTNIDLERAKELRAIIANEDAQKQKRERKAIKRLELLSAFLKGGNDPANMFATRCTSYSTDLRPVVQRLMVAVLQHPT